MTPSSLPSSGASNQPRAVQAQLDPFRPRTTSRAPTGPSTGAPPPRPSPPAASHTPPASDRRPRPTPGPPRPHRRQRRRHPPRPVKTPAPRRGPTPCRYPRHAARRWPRHPRHQPTRRTPRRVHHRPDQEPPTQEAARTTRLACSGCHATPVRDVSRHDTVPGAGVEPARPEGPAGLSRLRLPFRHPGRAGQPRRRTGGLRRARFRCRGEGLGEQQTAQGGHGRRE